MMSLYFLQCKITLGFTVAISVKMHLLLYYVICDLLSYRIQCNCSNFTVKQTCYVLNLYSILFNLHVVMKIVYLPCSSYYRSYNLNPC